jgi:hypothetical protein
MKNILKSVTDRLASKSNEERLAPATRQYFFRYER